MKKISKIIDIKNRTYGIVGLGALFLTGLVFGFILNGSDRVNYSMMTRGQCDDLAERIVTAAKNNQPDLIAQLNKVFSENCNNRRFRNIAKSVHTNIPVKQEKLPDMTCEAIEKLLRQELYNENSPDWKAHRDNSGVFDRLVKSGCEKNRETYQQMAQREMEIAKALDKHGEMNMHSEEFVVTAEEPTCTQIESLLQNKLNCYFAEPKCRVRRAQIYANMSERGCPENSQKYKELAAKELEIARALTDDNIEENRRETEEMVETYKRLQMQKEAAKMLDKARKLTNPAIDFIIQLEKIIEE